MRYLKIILPALALLITGCASTKQIVPVPTVQSIPAQQVRITINAHRNAYPPLTIKDGEMEIGAIGRSGNLTWDRPAGQCSIKAYTIDSSVNGQKAGLESVFAADMVGGQHYTFDLIRDQGIFSIQPATAAATRIKAVNLAVCVLPVVDDTSGKGIDIHRYAQLYKLPEAKNGCYFPANVAFGLFNKWQYTKPFYGGGESDTSSIYNAAKHGSVPVQSLPAKDRPAYHVLVVVKQFEDFFRVMWLVDSTVECYVIRAADGKVVYHGIGKGSGRAGMLDVDQKFFVGLGGAGNAWQSAIRDATANALKDMPILTP